MSWIAIVLGFLIGCAVGIVVGALRIAWMFVEVSNRYALIRGQWHKLDARRNRGEARNDIEVNIAIDHDIDQGAVWDIMRGMSGGA